jgi:hypothetical protein
MYRYKAIRFDAHAEVHPLLLVEQATLIAEVLQDLAVLGFERPPPPSSRSTVRLASALMGVVVSSDSGAGQSAGSRR